MHALTRLASALFLAAGSASAADARLEQFWPEHQQRLHEAPERAAAMNTAATVEASDADAKAVAEELLAEPHQALDAAALKGEWRVRSLQGGRYGIYVYPWFKARVAERDGRLFFEKTSGSQRRSGWLLPPSGGKGDWYFQGGATVNEDPQVGYSKPGDGPRESDSVGTVWGISEGRVLMLFDVNDNGYEIYQLKR